MNPDAQHQVLPEAKRKPFSIAFFLFCSILFISNFSLYAEVLDIQIKGIDDGLKTSQQQDYKEAVLFAKREAVEQAGVHISAYTSIKDLVLESDYIETKADAVLLPGFTIIDMGYAESGIYQVVLIGKIKLIQKETNEFLIRDIYFPHGWEVNRYLGHSTLCTEKLSWGMPINVVREIYENCKYSIDHIFENPAATGKIFPIDLSVQNKEKDSSDNTQIVYKIEFGASPYTRTVFLKFYRNALFEIEYVISINKTDEVWNDSFGAHFLGTKSEIITMCHKELLKKFSIENENPSFDTDFETVWKTKNYILNLKLTMLFATSLETNSWNSEDLVVMVKYSPLKH